MDAEGSQATSGDAVHRFDAIPAPRSPKALHRQIESITATTMMNNKKRGKHVVFTTGEIKDIKRRVSAGESLNDISLHFAKFSIWTIRRAAAGDYDDTAIPDNHKPLSDKQIQRLLSWPTLAQLQNIVS